MKLIGILVAAAGLCACRNPSTPAVVSGTGSGGGDTSLAAVLIREVGGGGPVAVVGGPAGLRALSADGTGARQLAPGPVPWVLVDATSRAIWFGSPDRSQVGVIDLDAAASDPPPVHTVITGLPTESEGGAPAFSIAHGGPTGDIPVALADLSFGHPITPHVIIEVSEHPGLSVEGGILELWEQTDQLAGPVAAAAIPGRDLLVALAARARPLALPPTPPEQRVDSVDTGDCEDPEVCGTAQPLANTRLWRVAVAHGCGDGCYVEWKLYDPQAARFLDGDWAGWLSDAWLAPDGSGFVHDNVVVRFDSGPLAATPPGDETGQGGGWLGAAVYYGP